MDESFTVFVHQQTVSTRPKTATSGGVIRVVMYHLYGNAPPPSVPTDCRRARMVTMGQEAGGGA